MKKILLHSILVLLFSSCASHSVMTNITKQLPPLNDDAEVIVYDRGNTVPENSEIIGDVIINFYVEETGPCTWEEVLETAKGEARAMGGNGVEIQLHAYADTAISHCHAISAFILNINDTIIPTEPKIINMDFHDYVVMKDGDTVPCSINFESKDRLLFYHGYNRQGYRKSLSLPKNDLLSYHIEDPDALDKAQKRYRKNFTMQFAVNSGFALCLDGTPNYGSNYGTFNFSSLSTGIKGSCDVRFNIWRGLTLGAHYGYYNGKGSGHLTQWNGHGYHTYTANVQQKTRIIAVSFGASGPIYSKRQTTMALLNGGGWRTPSMKKHWISLNCLLGYLYDEINEEQGDNHNSAFFVFGEYLGYDYLITDHLAIGATMGYLITTGPLIFDLTAGNYF